MLVVLQRQQQQQHTCVRADAVFLDACRLGSMCACNSSSCRLIGGEWLLLGWRWRKLCLLYMHVSSRSLPQAHALLLRAGLFCSHLHTPAEGADCLTCPSLFGTLIVLVPSAQRCTILAAL